MPVARTFSYTAAQPLARNGKNPRVSPTKCPDEKGIETVSGVLHNPLRTPTHEATRLRTAFPLVRGAGYRGPGLGRLHLCEEPRPVDGRRRCGRVPLGRRRPSEGARRGAAAFQHRRRTTRRPGYARSQRVRKRIEEISGWLQAVAGWRKSRFRGRDRTEWGFPLALAAYNLTRMPEHPAEEAAA